MEPNLDLIPVPAGSITLSDRRTDRRWPVEVASFQLAAVPVTEALYADLTSQSPDRAAPLPAITPPPGNARPPAASQPGNARPPAASQSGNARLPVTGVSWWDALRFCNALSARHGLSPAYHFLPAGDLRAADRPASAGLARAAAPVRPAHGRFSPGGRVDNEGRLQPDGSLLPSADEPGVLWDRTADGFRLPTEAEWEHACRAGTTEARYGPLDEIAWYRGNSAERIHEPGGKLPNAWGLHDMLGNAWDWCWDVYDAEVYGTYRVLRGGGWFDEHWSCRASVRRRSHPDLRIEDVSFRVARS